MKSTRLDHPFLTSFWESLSFGSRGSLMTEYANVLRKSVPRAVFPKIIEYTSEFLHEMGAKQAKRM